MEKAGAEGRVSADLRESGSRCPSASPLRARVGTSVGRGLFLDTHEPKPTHQMFPDLHIALGVS